MPYKYGGSLQVTVNSVALALNEDMTITFDSQYTTCVFNASSGCTYGSGSDHEEGTWLLSGNSIVVSEPSIAASLTISGDELTSVGAGRAYVFKKLPD